MCYGSRQKLRKMLKLILADLKCVSVDDLDVEVGYSAGGGLESITRGWKPKPLIRRIP
jgi:hypothetical protein